MFDFVRNHTRLLFSILIPLILASFLLVGNLDGFSGAQQRPVATVGGHDISQAEFDRAHQQRLNRVRAEAPQLDIRLVDTPEFRQGVLDDLVRQRVLARAVLEFRVNVTDDQLRRFFANDPQLAFLRDPDGRVNKAMLQASGMSTAGLEARLRQDLAERQVTQGLTLSSVAPAAVASPALNAYFQQRELQVLRFNAKDYANKITFTEAELQAYYQDPGVAARFLVPEQVDVEYVMFDAAAVAKDIVVSEDELKAYYNNNLTRYGKPEERRASHILIAAPTDAKPEQRAKARAKAEALLEVLRKNPGSFGEVAKKESQDAGSAKAGGDLDFILKDQVVKPFSDALYALKSGALSEVVETEQGFHIIQMTGQRGGDVRSFESVRAEILQDVRKSEAQKKFADVSQEFSNMVYEQGDTLQAVADKWKLELRTAQGLTRQGTSDSVVSHPKFLEAVFSTEALREKRNTPAVEVGAAQMVSARVLKHAPTRQPALADIREAVRAAYVAKASAALARKDGEERLAMYKASPPATLDQKLETVSRVKPGSLTQPFLASVLSAPTTTLPSLVGYDLGEQGYAVGLITRVMGPDPSVAAEAEAGRSQYAQVWDAAESQAYLEALKARFKVKTKPLH